MLRKTRVLSLFFLLSAANVVSPARLKIAISPQREVMETRHFRRASSACDDYQLIPNTSGLNYPPGFGNVRMPWVENSNTKVATSERVNTGIYMLFKEKVPGLNGKTIQDVIAEFQERGCLSFPYGGSVRDQFLNASLNDLDMESNCEPGILYNICMNAWDSSNCGINSAHTIVHVGDSMATDGTTDIIDASNWDKTFFGNGVALEYTTNSMTYFGESLNITIDITGNGISDTCNNKIRIPVDVNDRQAWVEDSHIKVYRFWKLRVKGYTAIDSNTMDFIVSKAEQLIMDNKEDFQWFYCKTVLFWKRIQ